MAQLIVRNMEEGVVRELEHRAVRHGRSVEEEHRKILREALARGRSGESLKELLLQMPDAGEDRDFERRLYDGRRVEL